MARLGRAAPFRPTAWHGLFVPSEGVTHQKTGALTAGTVQAGADVAERVEAGALTTRAFAPGADSSNPAETGTLTTAGQLRAADVAERVEAGSLTANGRPYGADFFAAAETGALIAAGSTGGPQYEATTAHPAADVTDGGWTDQTGGPNLAAALDELIADDADYITSSASPGSPDIAEVQLGSLGDPNSSTGHIVRYRYGKDSAAGDTLNLTVRLRQGTTTIASWTHTDVPAGWTDAVQTLSGAEADAITDYSDLRIRFEAVKV
jgi:hypothetical protein